LASFAWVLWKLRDTYQRLLEKDLVSQVVVITGGGSGLGRLLGLKLSEQRCKIALWDINEELLERTAQEIREKGGIVKTYIGDVSDNQRVRMIAEQIKYDFKRVDILINNAGVVSGRRLLENPDELIKKVIDVNYTSHFWTVKAFLPEMLSRNQGHIVEIVSLSGILGVAGLVDYASSKFGAFGFCESLRCELAALGKTGVKTTCVCPTFINTGMFEGVTLLPIIPMLEPEYVVEKTIQAIKREQAVLLLPRAGHLIPLGRALLPTSWFDMVNSLTTAQSMSTFKGRALSLEDSGKTSEESVD